MSCQDEAFNSAYISGTDAKSVCDAIKKGGCINAYLKYKANRYVESKGPSEIYQIYTNGGSQYSIDSKGEWVKIDNNGEFVNINQNNLPSDSFTPTIKFLYKFNNVPACNQYILRVKPLKTTEYITNSKGKSISYVSKEYAFEDGREKSILTINPENTQNMLINLDYDDYNELTLYPVVQIDSDVYVGTYSDGANATLASHSIYGITSIVSPSKFINSSFINELKESTYMIYCEYNQGTAGDKTFRFANSGGYTKYTGRQAFDLPKELCMTFQTKCVELDNPVGSYSRYPLSSTVFVYDQYSSNETYLPNFGVGDKVECQVSDLMADMICIRRSIFIKTEDYILLMN